MHLTHFALIGALALGLTGCHCRSAQPEAAVPADAPAMAESEVAVEVAVIEKMGSTVDILNAKMPVPGLLTGGQPTQAQFKEFATAGFKVVINLRTEGEQGSWDQAPLAKEIGIDYQVFPIAGAAGITRENAKTLSDMLSAHENEKVVIHCGSGNRVGALFALQAYYEDNKTVDDAIILGVDYGMTSLKKVVSQYIIENPR